MDEKKKKKPITHKMAMLKILRDIAEHSENERTRLDAIRLMMEITGVTTPSEDIPKDLANLLKT
jgi:hypothetical protein